MSDKSEEDLIREYAQAAVGADAQPTLYLRMITSPNRGRMQQKWVGRYGEIWMDIPNVPTDDLPPRISTGKLLS